MANVPRPDEPLLKTDCKVSETGAMDSKRTCEGTAQDEACLLLERDVKVDLENISPEVDHSDPKLSLVQPAQASQPPQAFAPQSSAIQLSDVRTEIEQFDYDPPPISALYPSHHSLNIPSLLESKSSLSDSSSAIIAICRICHMPGEENEILITPCRCAGTLQFIHNTCLQVSVTSEIMTTVHRPA